MRRIFLSLVVLTFLITLSGCGTMGNFRSANVTSVELSEANFNYVARDLEGSSMQGYLLGVSAPQGSDLHTFGLIKVSGSDKPYADAVQDLWNKYRDKYGDTSGKKLALVNIRQDYRTLNILVYTEAHYFITADVIEFTK
ncbi:MAG: hypothetical protein P8X42_09035 [Calditrichaceae bacterium]|jgi:uncharacterized protein YceK